MRNPLFLGADDRRPCRAFDEAGMYIRKKDDFAHHDNWLEGTSKEDIEKVGCERARSVGFAADARSPVRLRLVWRTNDKRKKLGPTMTELRKATRLSTRLIFGSTY